MCNGIPVKATSFQLFSLLSDFMASHVSELIRHEALFSSVCQKTPSLTMFDGFTENVAVVPSTWPLRIPMDRFFKRDSTHPSYWVFKYDLSGVYVVTFASINSTSAHQKRRLCWHTKRFMYLCFRFLG